MEKKDAKIVCLANLKGGVGKSFLTSFFASALQQQGFNTLVIDADDLQHTVGMIRDRDLQKHESIDNLFEVIRTNSIDALDIINNTINDFDYIFIDIPGNFKQAGVIECISFADILLIPTSLTDEDLDGVIQTLNILFEDVLPARNKTGLSTEIHGILYKVNNRSIEYNDFLKEKGNYPIKFFETVVPHSEVLKRQSSTIGILNYDSKSFNVIDLVNEFNEKFKIFNNE